MSNAGDIPQSLRLPQMAPLDDKNQVKTLSELIDLGEQNKKAFTYYRGMIVFCHEDKKRYEWTDQLENEEGLLPVNFKYPRGSVHDDINYSNLEFNFIEYNIPEYNLIILETNSEFESYIKKSKAKPGQIVFNKEDGVYYSIVLNSEVLEYEPLVPDKESDKNFTYDQTTPSKEWDIFHNLNKKPSVTIIDSANTVVEGKIIINDGVRVLIEFNAPFTGTAILN